MLISIRQIIPLNLFEHCKLNLDEGFASIDCLLVRANQLIPLVFDKTVFDKTISITYHGRSCQHMSSMSTFWSQAEGQDNESDISNSKPWHTIIYLCKLAACLEHLSFYILSSELVGL